MSEDLMVYTTTVWKSLVVTATKQTWMNGDDSFIGMSAILGIFLSLRRLSSGVRRLLLLLRMLVSSSSSSEAAHASKMN